MDDDTSTLIYDEAKKIAATAVAFGALIYSAM